MKRLGLDYPELAAVNPKLIYCAILGLWGRPARGAGRPAYAPVIHASTGYDMAHLFYQQGRQRPDNCGHLRRRLCERRLCHGRHSRGPPSASCHGPGPDGRWSRCSKAWSACCWVKSNPRPVRFRLAVRGRCTGRSRRPTATSCWQRRASATFQDLAAASGRSDWITDPRFEKYADRPHELGPADRRARAMVQDAQRRSGRRSPSKSRGVPCSPYVTVTEALKDPQVAHPRLAPAPSTMPPAATNPLPPPLSVFLRIGPAERPARGYAGRAYAQRAGRGRVSMPRKSTG